jgi:hypothetical protein
MMVVWKASKKAELMVLSSVVWWVVQMARSLAAMTGAVTVHLMESMTDV